MDQRSNHNRAYGNATECGYGCGEIQSACAGGTAQVRAYLILLPLGEGGVKRRMRVHPHPPHSRHPLPEGEGIICYLLSGMFGVPGTAPFKLRKSRVPSGRMKFLPTALFDPSFA